MIFGGIQFCEVGQLVGVKVKVLKNDHQVNVSGVVHSLDVNFLLNNKFYDGFDHKWCSEKEFIAGDVLTVCYQFQYIASNK